MFSVGFSIQCNKSQVYIILYKLKLISYIIQFSACFPLLDLSVSKMTIIESPTIIIDLHCIPPCSYVNCCMMYFETVLLVAYMLMMAVSSCLSFLLWAFNIFPHLFMMFLHLFVFCQILRLLSQFILVYLSGISFSILLFSWCMSFHLCF